MIGEVKSQSLYVDDFRISEKEKQEERYIRESANYWISSLYRRDPKYKTYRNYYNGVRDDTEFEHITDNYGIGTPSSLGFTPIIKPRIDSLLSQLEMETFNYSVGCTDEQTIETIRNDKEQKRLSEIRAAVTDFSQNAKRLVDQVKEDQNGPSRMFASKVKKINSKYGESYIDDFVSAAMNVLKYFEGNSKIDARQKLKQMLLDLLVTGECYYRVYVDTVGSDPIFEVIKPENIFFNKNTNSQYIDSADAVVHREYMTRTSIMKKYGKFMTEEQKRNIFGNSVAGYSGHSIRTGLDMDDVYYNDDAYGQKSLSLADAIEVFHVEWLAVNEVDIDEEELESMKQTEGTLGKLNKQYRVDRYEVVRIAGRNYVNGGKSMHISRSADNPYECAFTYDGVLYNDRNGTPYSMVGALKDLQDAYDLIIFHRDNLVANSGVSGDRVNMAAIPKVLGDDFMERLFKFIALKKNGVELYNPTEPGASLFSHYGNFDNSVSGTSITAINAILTMIQEQADIIAGTNPQMMGQIAERDAVSNVRMGIQRSLMRNQDLFEVFRTAHNRLLNNYISAAQISYKNGKKGSYIMGPKSYTFEIIPDTFCYSDFAITINYSSKDEARLERLQAIAKEYAAAGVLDPSTITQAVMSDSANEVNKIINQGYRKNKEEMDKLGQASATIDQLNAKLKEYETQLGKVQAEVEKLQKQDMSLKEREIAIKEKVAEYTESLKREQNSITGEHYERQDRAKEATVELERQQLMSEGPKKEVNNRV